MADAPPAPVAPGGATVDARNPWPGLEAFREADAGFFFGRERPSADLAQLLVQQRLVVLYGRSGLGKTSLLRAGVFPKLREARLLPVYVRVDFRALGGSSDATTLRRQVKAAIEEAAAAARVDAPALDPDATLWEWLYRTEARFWNERSRRVQPVIVFDQFEEAFTHGRRSDAISALTNQFLGEIVDVVRGSVPASVAARLEQQASEALSFSIDRDVCHILLSLRKEFLPELLRLRARLPMLLDHRLELRGMTHEEAARVVTGPGRELVEPGVEARIVDFVARARRSAADQSADEAMVDPALLSVFCRELNRRRQAEGLAKINAALLEGTRDTIIAEFYADSVKDLGADVQAFIEDDLITESGYRNSVAVEQALLTSGVTREVIDKLIDRRLLRSEGSGPEERLELTHDVLADPIMARRNTRREREQEEKDRLAAADRFLAAQEAAAQQQRDRDLAATRREADASALLLETKRRANVYQRYLLVGLGIMLIAAVVMTVVSWRLRREARSNLASAHVEQAMGLIALGRLDQGLAYIAQALRVNPDNAAARSLAIDGVLHGNWPLPVARLWHKDKVLWAEFDRASSRVVTVSADKTARIWSVPGGLQVGSDLRHDGAVFLARFSADGTQLLTIEGDSAGRPGRARLWDVESSREVQGLDHPGASVVWAAFAPRVEPPAPAAPTIVTGATDGTVRIWTRAVSRTFKAHADRLVTAQFSPTGAMLLTASADRTAGLWDLRSGKPLATLRHDDGLTAAQFSPDGLLVATASRDGTARLWATPRGTPLFTLQHSTPVWSVQFSPDGTRLVTSGDDGVARVWDTSNGRSVGSPVIHDGPVVSAFFASLGQRVITASTDQSARISDTTTGRAQSEHMRHRAALQSAVISRDMQFVVTSSDDGTAWIWDVRMGSAAPSTLWRNERLTAARFGPGGEDVIYSTADGSWFSWDGTTAEPRPLFGGRPGISQMALSRDGSRVLLRTGDDLRVSAWPGTDAGVAIPATDVSAVSFSPDGRIVVTGASDGRARAWDATSGKQIAEVKHEFEFDNQVRVLEFSADGSLVLSRAVADGSIRVWEPRTGKVAHSIRELASEGEKEQEKEKMIAVRFGTGATLVVTTGAGVVVSPAHLKDVTTGRLVADLPQEAIGVSAVFSPDGRALITMSDDGKVRLWEAATGQPIATLVDEGRIKSVEFSPDGLRIATGSEKGSIRLWDARTGHAHTAPLATGLGIESVRFDASGQRVLGVSTQGVIRVWNVPTGEPRDAPTLASLVETLTGYRVNDLGAHSPIQDRVKRLTDERTEAAAARGPGLAERLRNWALADRTSRTVSPFTAVTIDEFVKREAPGSDGFREAREWFPWHPVFRPTAAAPQGRAAARQ